MEKAGESRPFFHFLAVLPLKVLSVPIESERRFYFFVLVRLLDANRHPPWIKSGAGLRWKTL
jgi:hypothetical protein